MIELRIDAGIARLYLNRPERHNSLTPALLDELLAALERIKNSQAEVVILAARGGSFSTGGDLKGFLDNWHRLADYSGEIVGKLNQVVLAMLRLPQPIIAAVHGWVTGGSLGLVLGSDLVVVAESARFAPYYTEVGYSPDGGWAVLLPELIGRRAAAEVQYLNKPFGAREALDLGLANRLVADQELTGEAEALADSILAKVWASVRATKRLLNRDVEAWAQALELERQAFIAHITEEGVREGVERFLRGGKS